MNMWSTIEELILLRAALNSGGGIEKTITGNPIHILDALAKPAQALSVKLEPIQDLHGYDNPWPAGGGNNKFGGEIVVGKRWQNGSYVTAATNNYAASDFIIACLPSTEYRAILPDTVETIALYCVEFDANGDYLRAQTSVSLTPSNNSRTFTTDADTYMMAFTFYCASNISPASVGRLAVNYPSTVTNYSPYSNICPISGHTDADVTRTGKNLIPSHGVGRTYADVEYTVNSDGSVKAVGTANASSWWKGSTTIDDYDFINAGTYRLTGGISANKILYIIGKYADGTQISNLTVTGGVYDRGSGLTFTLTQDAYITYQIQITNGTEVDDTFYPMICKDTSAVASDFTPYVGTTYPIPLGTTVYGGTLDVLTGVLTVTKAFWTRNTADMDNADDTPGWRNSGIRDLIGSGVNEEFRNQIMNIGTFWSANTNGSNDILFLRTARYNKTQDEWKALAMDIQIVVELATPITIQLTPTQVELLQGENNIWSDGEMTLVYLADGNASDAEALNILLGGRYVNNHGEDEPTDREALDILLGR